MSVRAQLAIAWALAHVAFSTGAAQSDLSGKVTRRGAPGVVVASAEVSVPGLRRAALTDSLGRFRLTGLPPGMHRLVVRAAGYAADTVEVDIDEDESVVRDFALRPSEARLPEVRVRGEGEAVAGGARLAGFMDRRRRGVGQFLERKALAQWDDQRTSDALRHVPGLDIRRGTGDKGWVTSGRSVNGNACAFCSARKEEMLHPVDISAGAGLACYSDVYLDGALIFAFATEGAPVVKTPLFDVNTIPVSQIEAIEFYASVAQVPPQFNRTAGRCGVLVIWTRG
jgi:hypothetical protein